MLLPFPPLVTLAAPPSSQHPLCASKSMGPSYGLFNFLLNQSKWQNLTAYKRIIPQQSLIEHGAPCLARLPGQQVQGSTCLHLPLRVGVMGTCCHAWLSPGSWGSKVMALCLHTQLSSQPSVKNILSFCVYGCVHESACVHVYEHAYVCACVYACVVHCARACVSSLYQCSPWTIFKN